MARRPSLPETVGPRRVPPRPVGAWSDERVEGIIGTLLRWGVIVSAAVVVLGGIEFLLRYGGTSPDYRMFRGEPTDLRHVQGIVSDALSLRGRGLIQLGLLLLIATPIARVAFSVAAFAKQRDRAYVLITIIVLSILLYSISGGPL